MSKFQIVLAGHVDCKIIDEGIADGHYIIDVTNQYGGPSTSFLTLDLATLDSGGLAAYKEVIDAATYVVEEDALIWKITYGSHEFKFHKSFVRDTLSTDGVLTDLPDGTPLIARFETPGFEATESREISLWYNQAFDPDDMDLLAEIGIVITGTGLGFVMTNATECKVSFRKPETATEAYVIDYESLNQIIEPS